MKWNYFSYFLSFNPKHLLQNVAKLSPSSSSSWAELVLFSARAYKLLHWQYKLLHRWYELLHNEYNLLQPTRNLLNLDRELTKLNKPPFNHPLLFLAMFLKMQFHIAKLSPSSSSSWAELALFSANPTTPTHPLPGKFFLQLNLYPISYIASY